MLAGKRVVVTGSTSGIGKAIAENFAKNNANVMINGFGKKEDIDAQIAEMQKLGNGKIYYHSADMSKPQEIEAFILESVNKLDGIDILINNAGIQFVSPIDEFPIEKWDQIIAINLSASFHTIKHSVPHMKQQKWGRIINIASAHALVASPFKSAYVAAKHGIAGLVKVVALELAKEGITCNAICPGYVFTPLVENQIANTAKARGISEEEVINNVLLGAQPTKKFTQVQDIAGLVEFLCSASAANITGTVIPIDGGWTCQ
jgi:3-hydroxybutyrate dehydrogenase